MIVLLSAQCLVFILLFVFLIQLKANLKRYTIEPSANHPSLEDTPTISLCIPARNETHALEDCLNSAVSSDYPKLEIIVLDDCSQDKTSQIIRSFAQSGVRFVKGDTPSEGWLGKNNACAILANEARGKYLVFMSVDTRLEPGTLSTLVAYMREHKLSMASVLPRRRDGWRASVIFSPLRYFWQLVLPLGLNTPTATSLWVINSDALNRLGGFSAFKDKVMVENVLAQRLEAEGKYRFLAANDYLQIWYAKKWNSQVETAIRLWYPSLGKSIFYSVLAMLVHFLLFVLPFLSLVISLAASSIFLFLISSSILLLQILLFSLYIRSVHASKYAFMSILLLPFIALQEIALIAASAYQYKRGRVNWKGRNICYPKYEKRIYEGQ